MEEEERKEQDQFDDNDNDNDNDSGEENDRDTTRTDSGSEQQQGETSPKSEAAASEDEGASAFQRHLMVLLLELVDALHERASTKMDAVDLLTRQVPELLEYHLTEFRSNPATFHVHPAAASSQRLQRYLHGCALAIVQHALPSRFEKQPMLRQLVADVLASTVLTPIVVHLSDPHVINGWIVMYFEQLEASAREAGSAAQGKHAIYTYANTYTGFTRFIKRCTSVEDLLHVRSNLIAEITRATIIQDLKVGAVTR